MPAETITYPESFNLDPAQALDFAPAVEDRRNTTSNSADDNQDPCPGFTPELQAGSSASTGSCVNRPSQAPPPRNFG